MFHQTLASDALEPRRFTEPTLTRLATTTLSDIGFDVYGNPLVEGDRRMVRMSREPRAGILRILRNLVLAGFRLSLEATGR
jgi:hypothetical protein